MDRTVISFTALFIALASAASQTDPGPGKYTVPSGLAPLNSGQIVTIVQPGDDDPKPTLEWTALGDSYASGVGTDEYVEGLRCLRYDLAYPQLLNLNPYYIAPGSTPIFPPGPHKLNNVVCSGAEADDIIKYQLLDKETWGIPNISFGNRPAFGNPEFATLTAGGDDIDFPGMLFNCILGIHIPYGPTKRTCDDQRKYTWSLLNSGKYIGDLGRVIDAIMQKGKKGPKGDDFRLYMTGYGRFFNADTTGGDTNCDGTTFNIDGLWNGNHLGEKGAADAKLTVEMRKDFNNMADALNKGILKAVTDYNNPNVKFVDIQTDPTGKDILAGHRFCEKGVQEPDPKNDKLFFWHYPYGDNGAPGTSQPSVDTFDNMFATAWNKTWNEAGGDINIKYPKWNDFFNAIMDNFTPDFFKQNGIQDPSDPEIWGGSLGWRTRIFHPQFEWHKSITTSILTQYVLDTKDAKKPPPPPSNRPPPSPTNYCQGNQVIGNCQDGKIPPTGGLGCLRPAVNGGSVNNLRYNTASAASAAATYCSNLIQNKVVLDKDHGSVQPGFAPGAEKGGQISLSVLYTDQYCMNSESPGKLDFAALGQKQCEMSFSQFGQACGADEKFPNYDDNYVGMGGAAGFDCAIWSVQGVPKS